MLLKRRAVRLALKKLSKNAEDSSVIARRLMNAGIKGDSLPANCPIANYLRRETGVDVRVMDHTITNDWISRVPIKTPGTVAAFVRLFDRGYYPALQEQRKVNS